MLKKIEKMMRGLGGFALGGHSTGGGSDSWPGDQPGGRPGARHAPADIALGADIDCRPVSHIIPRGLQWLTEYGKV